MTWTGEAGPEIEVKAIPVLDDCELPLQRLYACERERAAELLFTQPIRGGVLERTWAGAMRVVRQVAAWLKAQNWPPGSRIAILSRNSAWWMMADFAIWMAGHVSVPFFPAASSRALTGLFRHCEPVACFLGAFENPLQLEEDIFDATIWVTFPNATAGNDLQDSTRWSEIALSEKPLEGAPRRGAFEVGTIIYTWEPPDTPRARCTPFRE